MKYVPSTVGGFLHHISTADGRALVNHFLGRYKEHTLPLLTRLRTSVIHNDANDNNVLVGRAAADPDVDDLRVAGIIDFGDMVSGFPVLELAVGATYATLEKNDPLAAAAPIVSGYNQIFPLTELELVLDCSTLEPAAAEATYVAERMKEKRILIGTEGPRHNVLKIRPPMVIEKADADRLIEVLDQVLSEDPLKH